MKSPITTHVLDTMSGKPAPGIVVLLEVESQSKEWKLVAKGVTNAEGRVLDFVPEIVKLERGIFRITFETSAYFKALGIGSFYPYVQIAFEIQEQSDHYHVPLLLSPFGYSTYRGS